MWIKQILWYCEPSRLTNNLCLHIRKNMYNWYKAFKYLGIDVLATNKWSICFESRLRPNWESYCMLENKCNQSDTHRWQLKLMLFNVMVFMT